MKAGRSHHWCRLVWWVLPQLVAVGVCSIQNESINRLQEMLQQPATIAIISHQTTLYVYHH
jgi:uncharacterized membrane protein YdcZ (DUF606 family)